MKPLLPSFGRDGFALAGDGRAHGPLHDRLDTILRLPFLDDDRVVPVGVVSKDYALVPHEAVYETAMSALRDAQIDAQSVQADLRLSEYGERMALSLYLPDEHDFDPGDGHPVALRLELLNSVDGSTRFRALMGWFRLVCSNGLVLGVTTGDIRRRHTGDVYLDDVAKVLTIGLGEAKEERTRLAAWRQVQVSKILLTLWADDTVKKTWGFKAATRAFHIATTGSDVEITGPYKDHHPSTVLVTPARHVPGAPKSSTNLFDISQALAWLAKERREFQEQWEWRAQIPELVGALP